MRRKYLVLREVKDSKHSDGAYVVVAPVELDERILQAVDVVAVPKQVADQLRETLAKHVKGKA